MAAVLPWDVVVDELSLDEGEVDEVVDDVADADVVVVEEFEMG